MASLLIDLDGTLVDSLSDTAGTLNQLLGERGLAPVSLAQVAEMVGDGVAKLVERGFAWCGSGPNPPDEHAALVARYLEIYEARLTAETRPYPGVAETLTGLQATGWRLAVCTNKPEAPSRAILSQFALDRHFETVGGGDSFAERKPAAGHALATLARMGAPRDTAVMVGDSPIDLHCARNAGLPAIMVSYGYSREPVQGLGADVVIDRFDQLPAAVAEILSRWTCR